MFVLKKKHKVLLENRTNNPMHRNQVPPSICPGEKVSHVLGLLSHFDLTLIKD